MGYISLDRTDRASIEREIRMMSRQTNTSQGGVSSNASNTSSSISVSTRPKQNPIQSFLPSLGKGKSQRASAQSSTPSINDELVLYRTLATKEFNEITEHDKEHDLFRFWSEHEREFPILGPLARKHLITPATSVPSESLFSVAAFFGRKERSRLTPDNLSMSVFIQDKVSNE